MNPDQNPPVTPPTTPQPTPEPTVEPAPTVDRSNVQSIYPTASVGQASGVSNIVAGAAAANEIREASATSQFQDSITMGLGLLSACSYIAIYYFVKNYWVTIIAGLALALVALTYAYKNYRATGSITPSTVIGISAATITLVNSATLVVTYLMIKSLTTSIY